MKDWMSWTCALLLAGCLGGGGSGGSDGDGGDGDGDGDDVIITVGSGGSTGPGPDYGSCCAEGDPCDWASDGACDCGGAFGWDAADCGGDTPAAPSECCGPADSCGWANDGVCDCGGALPWDAVDCNGGGSGGTGAPPADECVETADCADGQRCTWGPGCSRRCVPFSEPTGPMVGINPPPQCNGSTYCSCTGDTVEPSQFICSPPPDYYMHLGPCEG